MNDKKYTTIKKRDWAETKAHSSWQVFKIMAEFVEGFDTLAKIGPCITIFGSARTPPDSKYYNLAVDIAKNLCEEGFGVITGGGPGIMEAGNKGAQLANGLSVGLNIQLPFEQGTNPFVSSSYNINFDYFFVRKVMFSKYSQGFIMMPGGWGTMDEFFEIATLIQTKKFTQTPMICIGKEYWGGLFDWMKHVMLEEHHNISPGDLELIKIFDTAEEVVAYFKEFYTLNKLQHNF